MAVRQFRAPYCILLFACLGSISTASPRIFRKYKIVHEGIEVIRNRPEYRLNMSIRKFNRTTPVIDCDYQVIDPKVNGYQVWIEGYERLGLEHIYTKSAVSLTSNYCEFMTGKFVFNRGFSEYGHMPTSCPVKAGNYSFRNWVIDEKYTPPIMPGKFWRVDFYFGPPGIKFNSNETGKLSYYCKIVYL